MSNLNGRLMPRHRRSKLGPTRYYPRCNSRGCVKPLPNHQHVGVCEDCRARLIAAFRSALLQYPQVEVVFEGELTIRNGDQPR